ncbi:MAG: hypothetical protein ACM3U2_00405 [Deltaproteobacteria bacterium]
MNRFYKFAFGLTILALCGAPLSAADRPVPEEGALEVVLLRQQSVQKELKLTPDEVEKIHKHCSMQWEKAQKISKLSEPERDKQFDILTAENDRFVNATLTKDQRKRLHEIMLQIAGLLCLSRQDVAAQLGLTPEQKQRLPRLQKAARDEMEEVIHDTKKEEKRAKLKELRETSRQRLLELLTDAQEAKWKQMTGAPFQGDLAAFFDKDGV